MPAFLMHCNPSNTSQKQLLIRQSPKNTRQDKVLESLNLCVSAGVAERRGVRLVILLKISISLRK